MAVKSNIKAFKREAERIKKNVPKIYGERKRRLASFVMEYLVDHSPVDTGAYRAHHLIFSGLVSPGKILFEHTDRPGANEYVPSVGRPIFSPPNPLAVRSEMKRNEDDVYGSIQFRNQRFYAHIVECRNQVYAGGYDLASTFADLIAREPGNIAATGLR